MRRPVDAPAQVAVADVVVAATRALPSGSDVTKFPFRQLLRHAPAKALDATNVSPRFQSSRFVRWSKEKRRMRPLRAAAWRRSRPSCSYESPQARQRESSLRATTAPASPPQRCVRCRSDLNEPCADERALKYSVQAKRGRNVRAKNSVIEKRRSARSLKLIEKL